jgi:hypothetical protein
MKRKSGNEISTGTRRRRRRRGRRSLGIEIGIA